MEFKLLFVKGDRGLAANVNGRFYFPDKSSNIKEEGLYDCDITIDKDKYAFVKGTLIETKMETAKHIVEAVGYGVYTNAKQFCVKKIGASIILFIKTEFSMSLSYFDSNDNRILFENFEDDKRHYNTMKLYNPKKFENAVDLVDFKKEVINNIAATLSDDMIMELAVVAKSKQGRYHDVKEIRNINNKYIVVKTGYYSFDTESAYVYDAANKKVISIGDGDEIAFLKDEKSTKIDLKALEEFCMENHIAMHHMKSGYGEEEDGLFNVRILFMEEEIMVTCLDGDKLLSNISTESKQKAAKSFKKLEEYRKKVGKNMSKSTISEFGKLAPRNVLGL